MQERLSQNKAKTCEFCCAETAVKRRKIHGRSFGLCQACDKKNLCSQCGVACSGRVFALDGATYCSIDCMINKLDYIGRYSIYSQVNIRVCSNSRYVNTDVGLRPTYPRDGAKNKEATSQ